MRISTQMQTWAPALVLMLSTGAGATPNAHGSFVNNVSHTLVGQLEDSRWQSHCYTAENGLYAVTQFSISDNRTAEIRTDHFGDAKCERPLQWHAVKEAPLQNTSEAYPGRPNILVVTTEEPVIVEIRGDQARLLDYPLIPSLKRLHLEEQQ